MIQPASIRAFFEEVGSISDDLMKVAEPLKVEEALSMPTGSVRELKTKLKPGDVIFTAPHVQSMGLFSRLLFKPVSRKVQHTDYGHSSLYIGNGRVMEARIGEGTRRRHLRSVARKNHIIAFRPQVTPEEAHAAVRYAVSQEGTPYSVKHLLGSAAPFRARLRGRRPEQAPAHICSTLVANAYPKRQFSGASRLFTRPSEIMLSDTLAPVASFRRGER